jgi:hypothetical protein
LSLKDTRHSIRSTIWKAIAQSDLDLSALPKEQQETLVDLAADAAMLAVDDELGRRLSAEQQDDSNVGTGPEQQAEELLWEGRPFMSIGTRYMITSERVRIVRGIVGKDRDDIELIRIQDIDQSQTLTERMFSIGDVTIHSHDPSHPVFTLNNVRDPEQVHEILRRAVIASRKAHGLVFREEM